MVSASEADRFEVAVEAQVDRVLDELRAAGGRATTSRRALLRVLFSDRSHYRADELLAAVRVHAPDVHLTTVYRNLEELQRVGVVDTVHLGAGSAIYHLTDDCHGHIVCERCGAVYEVPDQYFRELAVLALSRWGVTIAPHHFAVLGTCPDCATNQSEAGIGRARRSGV